MTNIYGLEDIGITANYKQDQFLKEAEEYRNTRQLAKRINKNPKLNFDYSSYRYYFYGMNLFVLDDVRH